MWRVACAAFCLFILAGCADEYRAKDAVKSVLKDPDSAQWRNIEVIASNFVCGEVNAKNSMGGFTGFSKFLVWGHKIYVPSEIEDETAVHSCCMEMKIHMTKRQGSNAGDTQAMSACEAITHRWDALAP